MSDPAATSYDVIPYRSKAFFYTHPDRLGTRAYLFGMTPAPAERCRVLELGCAGGGNLLPLAQALPESQFVGIDLSQRQIELGQSWIDALGLTNIRLKAMSILDMDASLGSFDYILCHGVYSWVPPAVQDKILTLCAEQLTPQGVAYVSYNTYPGWHRRAMIREMMQFHVQQFTDPQLQVQQARAFLDLLIKTNADPNGVYARILQQEANRLEELPDSYLFHEHLEEHNRPLYFHEFMARAAEKRLQYLGEAVFSPVRLEGFVPEVQTILQKLAANPLRLEQYLDFIREVAFRRTLLCHDDVKLKRRPAAASLTPLHLTGIARPTAAQPDPTSTLPEPFDGVDGMTLTTNEPRLKTALVCLAQAWPRSVPFVALARQVSERLAQAVDVAPLANEAADQVLAETLLECYLCNLVELHLHPPRFEMAIGERPVASPLARLQAMSNTLITNLRHHTVALNEFDEVLLPHLDGSRDRQDVIAVLEDLAASDVLTLQQDGKPLQGPAARKLLEQMVEEGLQRLAHNALLLA